MNHRTVNHQWTTYWSQSHEVNDRPPMSDPMSDPISDPTSNPTSNYTSAPSSATSEMTVDREGDGRIRKGLEILGGR